MWIHLLPYSDRREHGYVVYSIHFPVEWFYSQTSKQLDGGKLEARSEYIKQIPVPDINATQKDLVRKLVDYLIFLQKQPTTNSKNLADMHTISLCSDILSGLSKDWYMSFICLMCFRMPIETPSNI